MLTHHGSDTYKPKRVVVIGAAGFVGRHVCTLLEKEPIKLLQVARPQVDLCSSDADKILTELLREGDVVVCASAKAPAKNLGDLQQNLKIANAVFEACSRKEIVHFVNVSSDAVYGDEPLPLTEQSPPSPTSIHGIMHLTRELLFAGLPCPVANVRPTLIFGKDDPHNGYGPNSFLRLANSNKPIKLFGNGEERRDHVSIHDVADLVSRVVLKKSSGVLNVATGAVFSFREIASMIVEVVNSKSKIAGSERVGRMPHNGLRTFDVSAIEQAFPGKTVQTFDNAVKEFASPKNI